MLQHWLAATSTHAPDKALGIAVYAGASGECAHRAGAAGGIVPMCSVSLHHTSSDHHVRCCTVLCARNVCGLSQGVCTAGRYSASLPSTCRGAHAERGVRRSRAPGDTEVAHGPQSVFGGAEVKREAGHTATDNRGVRNVVCPEAACGRWWSRSQPVWAREGV